VVLASTQPLTEMSTGWVACTTQSSESWYLVGFKGKRISVSIFFNKTSNCEKYILGILGQFFPELTELTLAGFSKTTTTAQAACISMMALSSVLGDRIMSSAFCSVHPPNLNPCDFFLGLFEGQKFATITPEWKKK
jgi:hypothetical protein